MAEKRRGKGRDGKGSGIASASMFGSVLMIMLDIPLSWHYGISFFSLIMFIFLERGGDSSGNPFLQRCAYTPFVRHAALHCISLTSNVRLVFNMETHNNNNT